MNYNPNSKESYNSRVKLARELELLPYYHIAISSHNYPHIVKFVEITFSDCAEDVRQNIVIYVLNMHLYGKIKILTGCNHFTRKGTKIHTFRKAIPAKDALVQTGYAKFTRGNRAPEYSRGIPSRLTPTKELLDILGTAKKVILEVNTDHLFDMFVGTKKLRFEHDFNSLVEDPNIVLKLHGLFVEKDTEKFSDETFFKKVPSERYLEEIQKALVKRTVRLRKNNSWFFYLNQSLKNTARLNRDFFSKIQINHSDPIQDSISSNIWLTRMFNKKGCGRHYQRGIRSYLQLKKESRQNTLTINNKLTSELDYTAMHINLLYNLEGKPCRKGDLYGKLVKALTGKKSKELRKAVKFCILAALNAETKTKFSRAINKKNYKQHKENRRNPELSTTPILDLLEEYSLDTGNIIECFKSQHPIIAKHIQTGIGNLLMLHDSNIMECILMRMMKENILGLPLYDAVICQKKDAAKVKRILEEEYKKYTGFSINVEEE